MRPTGLLESRRKVVALQRRQLKVLNGRPAFLIGPLIGIVLVRNQTLHHGALVAIAAQQVRTLALHCHAAVRHDDRVQLHIGRLLDGVLCDGRLAAGLQPFQVVLQALHLLALFGLLETVGGQIGQTVVLDLGYQIDGDGTLAHHAFHFLNVEYTNVKCL